MREIKFRWWNGQRMIEHKDIKVQIYNLKNMENLMQYTGLKDKNGKEIYEGDIVNVGYINKAKIEHSEAAFIYSTKFGDGLLWDTPPDIIDVIGNIYENPQED